VKGTSAEWHIFVGHVAISGSELPGTLLSGGSEEFLEAISLRPNRFIADSSVLARLAERAPARTGENGWESGKRAAMLADYYAAVGLSGSSR
jgi:hypothetical protein